MEEEKKSPAGAGAMPLDTVPTRGYVMPPPTFRVKKEFAAWDIDHTRFEVKKVLGKGSYGTVAEAFDHLTKKRVAIKKINTIFDVFENSKRIYREVSACHGVCHVVCWQCSERAQLSAAWGDAGCTCPCPARLLTQQPRLTASFLPSPPLPSLSLQIRILRALQHPYIVKLLHVSCPGINDASVDLLSFQDLYIVFECVDTDLAKLIKDETQVLTEQHIR